jgi:hypothetical protein
MVHDAVAAFLAAGAHFGSDLRQGFIPGDALPLAFAAFADAFQRVEDAFGVVDLVVGGGAFGAVAATAAGVHWVPLELFNFERFFVDVGEQAAAAFAVEAGGGNEHVAPRHALWPRFAIPFDPVIPVGSGRVVG